MVDIVGNGYMQSPGRLEWFSCSNVYARLSHKSSHFLRLAESSLACECRPARIRTSPELLVRRMSIAIVRLVEANLTEKLIEQSLEVGHHEVPRRTAHCLVCMKIMYCHIVVMRM